MASKRPLNQKEASYLYEATHTNFILSCTIPCILDLTQVHAALAILQESHPLLKSRIVTLPKTSKGAHGGFQFVETTPAPAMPVNVREVRNESMDEALMDAAETELNIPLPEAGPLLRVALILGQDNTGVVFCFHHAAFDGKCGFEIFRGFLDMVLGGHTTPLNAIKQRIEDGQVDYYPKEKRNLMGTLRLLWNVLKLVFFLIMYRPKLLHSRSPSLLKKPKTRLYTIPLTRHEMNHIIATAKSTGHTVTSLLIACISQAYARQIQSHTNASSISLIGAIPVDNRAAYSKPTSINGAMNTSMLVYIKHPLSSPIPVLAGPIRHGMKSWVSDDMHFHSASFLPTAPKKPLPLGNDVSPDVPIAFALSNLGCCVTGYGVGPVYMASTAHPDRGGMVEVTMVTVDGVGSLGFMVDESQVSGKEVEVIAGEMKELLLGLGP